MCKRTGWLEILGSGMVHPAVFEAVGYDPDRVTGFAFGMGIERVALLKWDVDDIRLFYENDLRFLEQFGPMKVLLSWMRDFVDVPARPKRSARRCRCAVSRSKGSSRTARRCVLLDFDVTANRPDCLSIGDRARDRDRVRLAAAEPAGIAPRLRQNRGGQQDRRRAGFSRPGSRIRIEEPDLCRRYVGAIADVTIGPSPSWMQARLWPAACARSTTSWTSPTTCCSSSASRCTPSISRGSPARRSSSAGRAPARR